MKRHPALHPLSRDHHDVLVHARRLRGLDARIDPFQARSRFLAYFQSVLGAHFDEEELLLAPRIADAALRQRLFDEHADLRQSVQALTHAAASDTVELGQKVREHVRFEEDLLFPHLEGLAGGLDALPEATAAFRARVRPASLGGGESCFL